jgi:competence protein ComEC
MIIGLCTSMIASWMETPSDEAVLTALDVGQGQCLLLQSDGKTYMVGCGGSDGETAADIAAEHLLARGIFHLDGLILTHFDKDHSSGAAYLLTRIPTDLLIVPDCRDEEDILQHLIPMVSEHIKVRDNIRLSYGTSQVSIFGPVVPDSGNESSLAVLFRHEDCDILITGDRSGFGERMLLRTAEIPAVDILVAGHHGSKHSTSAQLLTAAIPKIVVISVGENPYGHPASEVLTRISAIGSAVYRTDLHGNIIFRR